MPSWAEEHIPKQFETHASEGGLDEAHFTTVYCAFLFRNFDANGDGLLDVDEAQEALKFLNGGKPLQIAIPSEFVDKTVGVSKAWFWMMYKELMK